VSDSRSTPKLIATATGSIWSMFNDLLASLYQGFARRAS
jgi:hypothetical protein